MKIALGTILILPCLLLASVAEGRVCSPAPEYPYAKLVRSNEEKAFYKCADGHKPYSGSPFISCVDGQWSNLTLLCEKRLCGSAGELTNGHFKYEGEAVFGDKAYVICNDGYKLKGPKYIVCESTGWSSELPTCEEGEVTCSHPKVANSVKKGGALVHKVNDVLMLSCSQGFQLNGTGRIMCGSDGRWEPQPPQCVANPKRNKEVTCSPPKVPNSVTKGGALVHKVNDVLTLSCSQGFQLNGTGRITCGSDGRWQPRPPRCVTNLERNRCGVPENTQDSHANLATKYVTSKFFPHGAKVYYVCEVGFSHRGGSKYRMCIRGQWTPLQLKCSPKLCGSAGELLNGHYEYTGVEFGAIATAVCNVGYQLVGQGTRNCMSRGWDGHDPVCEALACDEPPEVKNAEIIGYVEAPYLYRTVVNYRCLVGSHVGPTEIWCKENGTWSTPIPQCKDVTCPSPNVPNASWVRSRTGRYQHRDSVYIQCSARFTIVGQSIITCGDDGQWLPELPKCRPAWNNRRN